MIVDLSSGTTALSADAESAIHASLDRIVADMQEAARISSISSQPGPQLDQMAEWIVAHLSPVLPNARRVPVPNAPDAVVARGRGARRGAILMYSHYDVQPPDPVSAWTLDPFGADVVDGRIYARGVVDDKADIVARIHALRIWRELGRALPCDLVWLSEGAEEIGSPGLDHLIRTELTGDEVTACLWESYLRDPAGRPELVFGCRGLLYVELKLRTLSKAQHSSFASVARSATNGLIRAVATLFDDDGRCAITGFNDGIRPFTPTELAQVDGAPIPSLATATVTGVNPYLVDDEKELRRRFATEPTCNVVGIVGGFTGDGMQTVLAEEATARIDFRLVPGQDPHRIVQLLRGHLDHHGHGDVSLRVLSASAAHISPQDFPLARAVAEAARAVMGEPLIRPIIPGTGPLDKIADVLGVPVVCPPGAFRMDSNVHGPDENVSISDLMDAVRFQLSVLEALSRC